MLQVNSLIMTWCVENCFEMCKVLDKMLATPNVILEVMIIIIKLVFSVVCNNIWPQEHQVHTNTHIQLLLIFSFSLIQHLRVFHSKITVSRFLKSHGPIVAKQLLCCF